MGRGQGRGRGKERGAGRGGGGFEDQYGEAAMSQDREEHSGLGGRGGGASGGRMSGGGEAGGGRRGSDIKFTRQVPKFLQGHMHLLGSRNADAPEEEQLAAKRAAPPRNDEDSGDEAEAERQDALRRAVAEDPSLAQQYPELAVHVAKNEAEEEKDKGNKAFAAKRFEDAVGHFSRSIALDKTCEVYYSNRSAALAALKRFHEALGDARAVVRLKPRWAKGWARLGAAHMGLEDFGEAREAYEKGLELEPDERGLQQAAHAAHIAESKAAEARSHKFKRREGRPAGNPGRAGAGRPPHPKRPRPQAAAGVQNASMLSFGGDEEEQEEEEP